MTEVSEDRYLRKTLTNEIKMSTRIRVGVTALLIVVQFVSFALPAAQATYAEPADEMLFYRDDGLFRYYNIGADGRLGGTDPQPVRVTRRIGPQSSPSTSMGTAKTRCCSTATTVCSATTTSVRTAGSVALIRSR